MKEGIQILLDGRLIFVICYIATIVGKCYVAKVISHTKNMTDDKAKYLTDMMTKDININLQQ